MTLNSGLSDIGLSIFMQETIIWFYVSNRKENKYLRCRSEIIFVLFENHLRYLNEYRQLSDVIVIDG